jgi:hypothetical protein
MTMLPIRRSWTSSEHAWVLNLNGPRRSSYSPLNGESAVNSETSLLKNNPSGHGYPIKLCFAGRMSLRLPAYWAFPPSEYMSASGPTCCRASRIICPQRGRNEILTVIPSQRKDLYITVGIQQNNSKALWDTGANVCLKFILCRKLMWFTTWYRFVVTTCLHVEVM